jgi:hypothetical protein
MVKDIQEEKPHHQLSTLRTLVYKVPNILLDRLFLNIVVVLLRSY